MLSLKNHELRDTADADVLSADLGIFDDNIAGKNFLSIGGCNSNLCIEALRRGAGRAVWLHSTIDVPLSASPNSVECIQAEFEDWTSDDQFDVVVCRDVLHQMFDPIHALRRMVNLRPSKIVLTVAAPTFSGFRHGGSSVVTALMARALAARHPIIAMGSPKKLRDIADSTYMFGPVALKVFFNRHYSRFEPVRIRKSRMRGRVIVEAKKRTIETLTVVTGPVASGKSTFTERLVSDISLRRSLSLPDEAPVQIPGSRVEQLPIGPLKHVIMQYGLLSPFGGGVRTYERDPVCDLFEAARRTNFLTIVTPRDQLREQLRQRDLVWKREHAGHRTLYDLYENPEFLRKWYENWFAFCSRHSSVAQNLVVENRGTFRLLPAEGWRAIMDNENA